MAYRLHAPVDPACPVVIDDNEIYDDPIMAMSGCAGEFREDFERTHMNDCERCREYGAANIEVI